MIRIETGVNDIADRLVGQLPDGRDDLIAQRRVLSVHQQHAAISHLQGDVAAGAHQHVDVALNFESMDFRLGQIRRVVSQNLLSAAGHRQTHYNASGQ